LSPGEVFSLVLGPNFFVYAPIFKIRSSKLVRIVSKTDQDIKKCSRVHRLAVFDNRISHMGQFELKSFFAGGGGIFSLK
jgi:hypothetical protein